MMKPEHLKLAGIVTMVCGGMSSLGAGAMSSDSPTIVTGRIAPMQSAPQDVMTAAVDAVGQDAAPAAPGVAQTQPETAAVAQDAAADVDVVSAARAAVAPDQNAAPVERIALDPSPALDGQAAQADDSLAEATNAATEVAHPANAIVALASNDAPVTMSLASNVVHAPDATDVAGATDVADAVDKPATGGTQLEHAALKLGEAVDVADVAHATDVADAVDAPATAGTQLEHAALKQVDAVDVADVTHATGAADAANKPATAGTPLEHAALKLGDAVDVATAPARRVQPADAVRHASGAVVEGKAVTLGAAQKDDEDPAWASADLAAVTDNRLDDMRGGFDLPSGLVVSFGISREAFVNGTLVSSTSFNIPNVAQMTPQQAQMLANANAGALVQNGLNNTVQPGALPGLTGAVIQNTLSNQQLQALTIINTTVNSLAAFKSMNLGQTLNSALLSAVRPR